MTGLRELSRGRGVPNGESDLSGAVARPVEKPPPPVVVVRSRGGSTPLRLTRRGRRVCHGLLVLAAALALLSVVVGGRADASGPAGPAPVVVVEPGDTLWNIATSHAPRGDPYVVMAEIRRLNRMPDSTVRVGERLVLPRR